MARMRILAAGDFKDPAILLAGPVDYDMYHDFRTKLEPALGDVPGAGVITIELTTLGGDPEVARMMGEDIRFHSDLVADRRIVLLGKAALYSAGTTFMSFFQRDNRYLTRGARLMIHERNLAKTLEINGPLTSCLATVHATINEIKSSIEIQNEGFENLVRDSRVTMEEVLQRAPSNWYIEAQEAVDLGLVAAVI